MIRVLEDQPPPKSLEAYLKILKALELVYRWNMDDNLSARKLYQQAIALDPSYGPAMDLMGWTYFHEAHRGWSDNPAKSLEKAEELGQNAIRLGGIQGHTLLMCVYSVQGKIEKAIAEGEKGLEGLDKVGLH